MSQNLMTPAKPDEGELLSRLPRREDGDREAREALAFEHLAANAPEALAAALDEVERCYGANPDPDLLHEQWVNASARAWAALAKVRDAGALWPALGLIVLENPDLVRRAAETVNGGEQR